MSLSDFSALNTKEMIEKIIQMLRHEAGDFIKNCGSDTIAKMEAIAEASCEMQNNLNAGKISKEVAQYLMNNPKIFIEPSIRTAVQDVIG